MDYKTLNQQQADALTDELKKRPMTPAEICRFVGRPGKEHSIPLILGILESYGVLVSLDDKTNTYRFFKNYEVTN